MNRLYGRAVALTQARQRLQQACAGQGGVLLFTGEPGIGKSRLAEQLAGDAAQAGAQVAWGRCWEAGGAPAYWPWIQLFRELGLDADPFAATLAPGENAEQARFRVFDAVVRRLKDAAARRPLVLVLDDLQAADVASLMLLLLLARQLRAAPILVAGTYRDAESRLTPELAGLLVKVAREGDVLPLARLDGGECGAWIREAWPTASEADVAQLQRLTEEHPLFLVEALRLGPGVHARQRVVEGLGAVLDERLAHLAPSTHTLLQAAAVLGREFAGGDVAPIADADPDEVHRALAEASAASIVLPQDGERFRFSHVLLRDRLYAALAPSARAALHWRAGVALLERGRDARAVVHHLIEGIAAGEPARLAAIAADAAEASLERLAFEDAARIAEQTLGLASTGVDERLICRLKLAAGESAIRLGDTTGGRRHCVEAAARAEAAGADALVVRAALVYGTDLASGSVDATMIALLRRALARLPAGDGPLRARVGARLAAALSPPMREDDTAEMRALAAEAVAMARRIGDPATLLYVLPFVAATTRFDGPDSERFTLLQETVALARLTGQRLSLLHALPGYVTALLARGRMADAERELAGYDGLLAELLPPAQRWRSCSLHALVHLVRGQFDDAERMNAEAGELAAAERSPAALSLWMFQRFSMAHLRGRPDLMIDGTELLVRQFASAQSTMPFAAWLAAAAGQREQAAAHLRAFRMDPTNYLGLCAVGDACVRLGDAGVGAEVYGILTASPVPGPLGALAPGSLFGPPGRTLGDLAALLGKRDEAVAHYRAAAHACEQLGAHWLAEQCRTAAERASDERGSAEPPRRPPQTDRLQLRREGDVWAVIPLEGASFRLKHGKGLEYLNVLLERPGREVHVLELMGLDHRAGDAGAVLDARAKQEYRQRLSDLRDQLAEAERFQEPARGGRIQSEIDAITEQLAAAVGLGGRDRVAASDVERARINVQRRLKDAIDRIAAADPALGRYLAAAVRTGTTCTFTPV